MPISITCPQCGKTYRVPDERAGQSGRCACGRVFQVPAPSAPDTAPLGPPPSARLAPGGPAIEDEPLIGGPGVPRNGPAQAGTPGLRCPNCGVVAQFGASECAACGTTLRKKAPAVAAKRPMGIAALVILYSLFAFILLVAGGAIMAVGGHLSKAFTEAFAGAIGARITAEGLGVGLVAISLLILVLAVSLWRGAGWARMAWRGLLALHFAFTGYNLGMQMYTTRQVPLGLPGALVVMGIDLIFLNVLRSQAATGFCSR